MRVLADRHIFADRDCAEAVEDREIADGRVLADGEMPRDFDSHGPADLHVRSELGAEEFQENCAPSVGIVEGKSKEGRLDNGPERAADLFS
jgi:hypothetical protein